jgi:hypothetical protein
MTAFCRFCWFLQFLLGARIAFEPLHIVMVAVSATSLVLTLRLSRSCLLACLKKRKSGH